MTRSKIFLGLTTGILAVAGVAATKAARFGIPRIRFYCTHNPLKTVTNALCKAITSVCENDGVNVCTKFMGPTNHYTLYTDGIPASTRLLCKVDPEGAGDKCQNVLSYATEH